MHEELCLAIQPFCYTKLTIWVDYRLMWQFDESCFSTPMGMRLLEERELKLATLHKALIDGEESGKADYALKNLLAELDQENI